MYAAEETPGSPAETVIQASSRPSWSRGPSERYVSGAPSTRNSRRAAVGSTLPAASIARTRSVCSPSNRPRRRCGELHGFQTSSSGRHSNAAPSGSEEENATSGSRSVTGSGKGAISVSGGVSSCGAGVPAADSNATRRRAEGTTSSPSPAASPTKPRAPSAQLGWI